MSDRSTDARHELPLEPEHATVLALRQRVEELESERTEPIAIIGMACRFPGPACDLEGYWRVLEGAPAISRIDQRFDADAIRGISPNAGLLPSIADFDPSVFDLTPKEAAAIDPQQRLLLELSWEALEHAGYAPTERLAQPTGVYVGLVASDYREIIDSSSEALDAHCATGNFTGIAAGRIAYTFGLQGPAIVIDSGCSGSLVAIHLGCQSLRQGECRLVLAGAVNIIASPLYFQLVHKSRVLSPTGECRPFDARADGFIRAEGGGMVVLKRLRDALADRDSVLAVVRGSAVVHHGRSPKLTAPTVESQVGLLRAALRNAGVSASQLTCVEAGTGTALGDRVELEALRQVVGEVDGPRCHLGSVKANIGHVESAAGVASLIKIILAMRHRQIPKQANFTELNPNVSLDGTRLAIPTEPIPWTGPGPLVAGVSNLSLSGTSAHVVVEEGPPRATGARAIERSAHVLVLSARSSEALDDLAARFEARLASPDAPALGDVCFTASTGRVHFRHRAALVADSTPAMVSRLRDLRAGARTNAVLRGHASVDNPPRVAFLFTGDGARYPEMGRGLRDSFPQVRRTLETCDQILRPLLGRSLLEIMDPPPGDAAPGAASLLERSAYALPAIFALEYAVARLWMSWGIEPNAVLGDGVGEYAAACIAGVLGLEEGLRLAAARGAHADMSGAVAADLVADLVRGRAAVDCDVVPPIPVVSTFTGRSLTSAELGGFAHWRALIEGGADGRSSVTDGLRAVMNLRSTALLEVGPTAALFGDAREAGRAAGVKAFASLRGGGDDVQVILESLGALHVEGADVDWQAFDREFERQRVELPTYPFQRKPLWLPSEVILPARRPRTSGSSDSAARAAPPPVPARNDETRPRRMALSGSGDAAQVEALVREEVAAVTRMEIAELDVHEPLQRLGLDSLMTIELQRRLFDACGVSLPLVSFMTSPSIAGLAARLAALLAKDADDGPARGDSESGSGSAEPLPAIEIERRPADRHAPFQPTDLQQAYLLGRSGAFELGNISTFFLIEVEVSNVDLARLEWAFQRLIDRHDMLRAVVLPDGTQQVLKTVPPYRIQVADLRALDTESRERALLETRQQLFEREFDTARWPLFEVRVSRIVGRRVRIHIGIDVLFVDGRSASILLREWSAIYQGKEQALPALSLTFRDYVLAFAKLEQAEQFQRDLAFWQERLPTLPPAPDLPLARYPASIGRPRFTHRQGHLDAASWSRFKSLAAEHGVSPSSAVCRVYAEVLAAWSKSSKFTLNLLSLNRLPLHPQVSSVLGNFSSTTLLEVDMRPGEPFGEGARRLQHQLWTDLQHGLVNGVRVLRELNRVQGSAGRAGMPIVFASMLSSSGHEEGDERGLAGQLVGMGDDMREVHFSVRTPQVWLDHQATEAAGELVLKWDVVDELFPEGMVTDAFQSYLEKLEQLSTEPAAWKAPAAVSVPAAQLEARAAVNRTAAPMREALLHQPFLERVAVDPNRVAVISARRTLSYGELDNLSERVAAWLRANGAGPGRLVAVTMEKGWEQVVAVLAVLKAGAAYVPIDPGLPRERLLHLLRHTEADCVLTQSHVDKRIEWPERVHRLAVDECGRLADPTERQVSSAAPHDLAYVIYTSGSTGLPKGVMIEHRSALNTILDVNERLGVLPTDRLLGLSALSFDLSVHDIFGALAAGAALVLPAPEDAREPARWLAQIASAQVTVWNSVPALMEMLVDHLTAGGSCDRLPLRAVMMSGDWIPIGLPARIAAVAPDAALYSLGGATEASIWSIIYPIERVDPTWTSVPYGKPMRNQRFEVLDEAMRPRPVWVPGDLYIAGEGLARGYWRDEEKTSASFCVHPRTGERLYRTGDLGRYLPDGNIEFLGRADFQVKVNGYRIELGEIEAALLQVPGVRSAVAVATGERTARRLFAYAAPEPGIALSEGAIMDALRAKIPSYAIPQRVLLLENLPLSANGKVDRRGLPDPEVSLPRGARTPARTETEHALVASWGELLGRETIGVNENFFELGGQSLLAVRLVGLIRHRWGLSLPLGTLFEHPTIEKLAHLIDRDAAGGDLRRTALVALRDGGTQEPLFFAHPVGGNVLCYADLAAALGPAQPFYGLQAIEDVPGSSNPVGIEEMATGYVTAIRERQPSGPYRVGGWSMGGVLAYEMCQQLRRAGEQVELLTLVDVGMSPSGRRPAVDGAWLLSAFARDLAGVGRRDLRVDAATLRPLCEADRMALVLEQAHACGVLPPEIDTATLAGYFDRFCRNYRAMLAYQPASYDGRLLFLRAADGAAPEVARGWAMLASKSEVLAIEGDHFTVCRPEGAAMVAGLIASRLTSKSLSREDLVARAIAPTVVERSG